MFFNIMVREIVYVITQKAELVDNRTYKDGGHQR